MAYIGKTPTVGSFIKLDDISTSSTNSYTMQHNSVNFSPESANHMLVSLNGVIQAPNTSFSISGSTITFLPSSGTLSSSDSIDFIMVYGNVLDVGVASSVTDSSITKGKLNLISDSSSAGLTVKGDGSSENGTIQLNCSQNSHGVKISSPAHSAGQSYELILPTGNVTADKVLKVASVSGSGATGIGQLSFGDAGGDNTPAFMAYLSSGTSISNTTGTKIVFGTEVFDTDSAYNTSDGLFTVPSGEGGKYFFNFQVRPTNWNTTQFQVFIRINGSTDKLMFEDGDAQGDNNTMNNSGIINLSASDTVAVYVYQDGGNGLNLRTGESNTYFSGYKLIGI